VSKAGRIGAILVASALGVVFRSGGGDSDLGERKPPTMKLLESELVATISEGEEVDIEAHLKPGMWTLVEFYADW